MKLRKDITEFLIAQLDDYYKKKDFKFYEQKGLLYAADYDEAGKISHFDAYDLFWCESNRHLVDVIEKKFNVRFQKDCDVVCKCGKSKNFSAYYGDYNLSLRCNSCDNEFSVYSG